MLVGIAVALRVWRVRLGLPDFLEEAIPFRIALGMMDVASGRVDWNPHSFNYPSLGIYLHLCVQQITYGLGHLAGKYPTYADYVLSYYVDPTPMVLPARAVGIVCDALAVVGVVRLAGRLTRSDTVLPGAVAGLLVAFAPILITTSRSIFCDSVMGVLAVWGLERMCAWHDRQRPRDLVAAALLVGLAAGAKYPAGVLVLPMAFLVWDRRGTPGLVVALQALSLAFVAFLATTPYAVLDPRAFLRDFAFEGGHAAGGHFGSVGHRSFWFHAANLTASLGGIGILLLAISPFVLARDRERRPALLAAWIALLGFGVPISLAKIPAERYLVPVLLIAAPLAVAAGALLLSGIRGPGRRWAAALGALALVGPPLVHGTGTASCGSDTTQLAARRWCESNVRDAELMVQEGYAARLPSHLQLQAVRSESAYQHAGRAARAQLDGVRTFHVVTLPLGVAGQVTSQVTPRGGAPIRLLVADHASALNRVFYDPRLFTGADYFMTSSAVRSRYESDSLRYPVECAFYRFLDSHAEVVARFAARGGVIGPEIVVYRIGSGFRDAARSLGTLAPDWWTAAIPTAYRKRAQALLEPAPRTRPAGGDTTGASRPAWVASLAGVYSERIQPFAFDMAMELAVLGHDALSLCFANATLEVDPDDLEACLIYGTCAGRLGRWEEARAATGRAIAARPRGDAEPALVLLHARALDHTGHPQAARAELTSLASRVGPDDPVGATAREMIRRLSTSPARGPAG